MEQYWLDKREERLFLSWINLCTVIFLALNPLRYSCCTVFFFLWFQINAVCLSFKDSNFFHEEIVCKSHAFMISSDKLLSFFICFFFFFTLLFLTCCVVRFWCGLHNLTCLSTSLFSIRQKNHLSTFVWYIFLQFRNKYIHQGLLHLASF
jgi:hypothetical protein